MNQFNYQPVDKHDEHGSHFHAGVESFHGEGHYQSNQQTGSSILSELRKEFYSKGDGPFKSKLLFGFFLGVDLGFGA